MKVKAGRERREERERGSGKSGERRVEERTKRE